MLRVTKKFFRVLTKKQKRFVFVLALLMLIGGVMESLSATVMLPLISAVMDADTWNTSTDFAVIICNLFDITKQAEYIKALLWCMIGIYVFKNLYLLFQNYVQFTFVARGRYNMQVKLMHRYIHKPYAFYLNSNSGEIVRVIKSDTGQSFALLTNVLTFYTEIIVAGALAVTIFAISPMIAVAIGIILVLELFVIAKIIKPLMRRYGTRQRAESALAYKWILQSLNGIKSIKVGCTEDFFEGKYSSHAANEVESDRKNQIFSGMPRMITEAVTIAGALLMMLIFMDYGVSLEDLFPQLSAFVVAAARLIPSANRISTVINQLPYLEGALDNILTNLEATEKDLEEMALLEEQSKQDRPELSFEHGVELSDVTFAYESAEKNVLCNANMEIALGQSVGIVGASGAGKTTAIDIILGLLKPQGGQVLVDGVNIEKNLPSWLSHLAYIPQQIFLMDDTIRENVAFGKHRDEIDEQAVWNALREAQLEEFVKGLPDGLDTTIGEAGVRLSGGQRQRIGIARALYNNPDILFFDEATSALDNETEAAIMESIDHFKGRKTLIIIAHRLTTIENCDIVYRVENGEIVRER